MINVRTDGEDDQSNTYVSRWGQFGGEGRDGPVVFRGVQSH